VFADPQVRHLGMATPMQTPSRGEVDVVASPINMSGLSKEIRLPTPEAGAHTDEVLRAAGYSEADIGAMRQKGVV
jgi:crotonobetainyl-CoA:carnitine CoA-transferase CaiB-like acyl-CoA transferase